MICSLLINRGHPVLSYFICCFIFLFTKSKYIPNLYSCIHSCRTMAAHDLRNEYRYPHKYI